MLAIWRYHVPHLLLVEIYLIFRHIFDVRFTESLSQCVNRVYHGNQICSEHELVVRHVQSIFNCIQVAFFMDGFDNEMLSIMLANLCIEKVCKSVCYVVISLFRCVLACLCKYVECTTSTK